MDTTSETCLTENMPFAGTCSDGPGLLICLACLALPALAQWDDNLLKPFVMDHRAAAASPADVSFLLDAPAGKDGFIRIQDGHFVKPNGQRIRFWGVHFTDWSRGSVEMPPKEDTPMWAATLARFGVNIVRLHFLDLPAPRGIIDSTRDDSRAFDPQQLDRLDYRDLRVQKARHLRRPEPQRGPLLQGRRRRRATTTRSSGARVSRSSTRASSSWKRSTPSNC